jgi:exopolysaccharide biosynthesis WecB/TagA/CpsF family protein
MGAALSLAPRVKGERAATKMPVQHVTIGGLRMARLSRSELAKLMVVQCLAHRTQPDSRPKLVFSANGQVISLAGSNAEFRRYNEMADLIHADGQPIVFMSKWLTRAPIPERSATTDFFHDAALAARANGLSMYLLGGREDVNVRCVEIMRNLYPGLKIAGRHHGYFSRDEEPELCKRINASGADIVWVGLGVPLEQKFCIRNRDRLRAGWLVPAGGCFNYVTGDYKRAPGWMQRAGLEWLHRLWHEPRRLFLRYAITNPHALYLMLTRSGSRRGRRTRLATEKPRLEPS